MNNTFTKNAGQLTFATMVLWALAFFPARSMAGQTGVEGLTIAALLCLLPGLIVFAFVSLNPMPNQQAFVVLAGTGFRLVIVALGMMVVMSIRRDFTVQSFPIWIAVFYLETLAVETWLVVSGREVESSSEAVETNGEAA